MIVSACLAGCACRFDGRAKPVAEVQQLVERGQAVAVCPEVAGGLDTPRRPAEISGGDGGDVLDGRARVVDDAGCDVTEAHLAGAAEAVRAARAAGAETAVLKDNSPSCGSRQRYDGTFTGTRRAGQGVTAAALRRAGVAVRSENEPLPDADA
jgi:uncharacterized protein YbbK (DUF523 family)